MVVGLLGEIGLGLVGAVKHLLKPFWFDAFWVCHANHSVSVKESSGYKLSSSVYVLRKRSASLFVECHAAQHKSNLSCVSQRFHGSRFLTPSIVKTSLRRLNSKLFPAAVITAIE